jgi:hypothetical protein
VRAGLGCRRSGRPGEAADRLLLAFAGRARLARLSPDDRRLDDDVIGPADHQQMLDIVAPHDDQLPLAVDLEGVNDAEPLLAAAAARQFDAAAEDDAK